MITEPAKAHSRYLPYGYRKHNVFVTHCEPGTSISINTDWSGGSRDSYVLFSSPEDTNPKPIGSGAWGKSETPKITLEQGQILVQSGIFMGKTATAHIYYCDAKAK
jgi:hypothetical protein